MTISVLIAAHQSGARLAAALDGIRNQTHQSWELIVVDHGPADETPAILTEFKQTSARPVRYEHLPEEPMAVVRNRLLELAEGDAVAFLNPEDVWSPRHLADIAHHLSTEIDVVISDVRLVDRKSGRPLGDAGVPAQLITQPIRTLFSRDPIASLSAASFRRALAGMVGGFDPSFRIREARDFWLRCALAGARFAATGRTTCQSVKQRDSEPARALLIAEQAVRFYDKHRDLAAVPAALRRRLLAAALVTHGRLLRNTDPERAAHCFWRAWSMQPVHVQTLGQFALTGWTSSTPQSATPFSSDLAKGN